MKVSSVVTTPNPDALKFTLDQELLKEGSRSFTSFKAAEVDPLAKLLFELEGVTSVFYMMNFVTVNKKADLEWEPLEKSILEALRGFEPPVEEVEAKVVEGVGGAEGTPYGEMSPAQKVLAIDQLLEREIRPGLAGDGGGLEIVGLEENILQIHYEGACGSCPSSTSGTLMYIESILKANLDENLSVIPV
jgi:NFU1 iron-sulfur cluster scaffold homolog, mitochondrial